jgi:hypothetical protein
MTTLFVLLTALAVVATLCVLLSRVVRADGYRRTPHPPANHAHDLFAVRWSR